MLTFPLFLDCTVPFILQCCSASLAISDMNFWAAMEISRVLHNIHVIMVLRIQKPIWINYCKLHWIYNERLNFSKIYNFWLNMKFKDSCDKTKPMLIHGFQKTGKCKTICREQRTATRTGIITYIRGSEASKPARFR